MKYTLDAIDRAEEELSRRRNAAFSTREEHLQEISRIAPEIIEINNAIKSANFDMLRAVAEKKEGISAGEIVMQVKEKNRLARKKETELLSKFGYPDDYLKYKYECEKCKDTGYKDGVRCDCLSKLLEKYTVEEMNKNCYIQLHNFDEFILDLYPEKDSQGHPSRSKMQENLNGCLEYVRTFSKHSQSLFFFGGTGLGKTFLCSCIANSLLNGGFNVVFASITKLLNDAEAEHFNRKTGDTLGLIFDADLVILDDLGSEFKTNYSEAALYEIINDRLNARKPTIVSTNLSPSELNARYNERIVSRLVGGYVPLVFTGKDIRFEKRKRGIK